MDNEIISNIKSLTLDIVCETKFEKNKFILSATNVLYNLFSKQLNISINDPKWINRDRFILASKKFSALVYSNLYLAGYNLTIDDLKNYGKMEYKTPVYPLYEIVPGIGASTGVDGEGFVTAVGMSLGQKILSSKYVIPKKNILSLDSHIIDYKIYVLAEKNDLISGKVSEAATVAGKYKLNNLILLCDSTENNESDINILEIFKSNGWNTIDIKKNNNLSLIDKAISSAKNSGKPTIIEFIGDDLNFDMSENINITETIVSKFKALNNIPNEKFYISDQNKKNFINQISSRCSLKYASWASLYEEYVKKYLSGEYEKLNYLFDRTGVYNILNQNWQFDNDTKNSTFKINNNIVNTISRIVPNLICVYADENVEMKTFIESGISVSSSNYDGKNIFLGKRFDAIGSITNGLTISKFIPVCSINLARLDKINQALKDAVLSKLQSVFIFSNDSINCVDGGVIEHPVEQLSILRSIHNLNMYRPCDAKELVGCWQSIINTKNKPSVLILSNHKIELLSTSRSDLINRGGYVVFQIQTDFSHVIVASGTDVYTAFHIANDLWIEKRISVRVVSMPCINLFFEQSEEYQTQLLPIDRKTFVIESSNGYGLDVICKNYSNIISIKKETTNGTINEVLKAADFDYKSIKEKIISKL